MNAQDFAYWLQGFVEISGEAPNEGQWAVIKDHLNLVFKKVTPYHGGVVSPGKAYIVGERSSESVIAKSQIRDIATC